MERKQILSYIDIVSTYIIAGVSLLLPLFFLPITTDALEMPKQLLLTIVMLVLLLLFGIKAIVERKVSFRRTPIDLGLLLLFVVIILSTIFSPSRTTALISAVPLIAVILYSFLLTNTVTDEKKERILVSSLLTSGALVSLFSILQFLKIYILPYAATKTAGFSLTGSPLASVIFLVGLVGLGVSFIRSYFKKSGEEAWSGFFIGTTALITIGALVLLYQVVATGDKPVLLSQQTGLRTALQPLGLNFQSALFGTGPGTYLFNFTRFKDPAINATNLWNLRFTNSSSFALEILSTMGILGLLSMLFIVFRVVSSFIKAAGAKKIEVQTLGLILSIVLIIVLSLFLPFSFISVFLLFTLLGLFYVRLANEGNQHIYDVTLSVVALKKGLISLEPEPVRHTSGATDIMPYILFAVFLLGGGLLGFNIYKYVNADITFQKALVAASQNKAKDTYDLQNAAINTFPNQDSYHRIFSQTNLAIANSIVQQGQSGTTLSDQDRQNIITLVTQSINFGRNAITISPLNVVNWENLTNVYRSLIGFAQSADQFAVFSAQQAVQLDPVNPLERLNLGGIYYQLGQYDLAIQEFATVTNLKSDFANGHYNLGHAYEAKGGAANLQAALNEYITVRNLVDQNSDDYKNIQNEITALQKKIPGQGTADTSTTPAPSDTTQEPLKVATPSSALPTQKPPVTVEAPPGASNSGEQR